MALRPRRIGFAALLLALGAPALPARAADDGGSCVACHRDPAFRVTHKKLYDYFQDWQASIHSQEGVTCDECHGGRPEEADRERAHAGGVGAEDPGSGVYYANVNETCGGCHEEILEGYATSEHFKHVEETEGKQGPTCVTCHGSINVEVLNVNTVEAVCSHCHNDETGNHPELPARARGYLHRFLSIGRFYRYIALHASGDEARAFFAEFDPKREALSVTWHGFDLDRIEEGTKQALGELKAKRHELRRRGATPPAPPAPPPEGEEGS